MRRWLVLLLLVALSVLPETAQAQVMYGNPRAIDGDTLDFGGMRVRLFGIDAPEIGQACERDGVSWACGSEARELLESLVAGEQVECSPRSHDRYGRAVAVCSIGRQDLAETLARTGLAIALEQFSADYVAAAEQPRASRLGIWAGTFEIPADFRASDPASRAELAELERAARAEQRTAALPRTATSSPGQGVYFRNCNEARAAGAAPLHRGQPGYREGMDGDRDGIACEPVRPR